MARNWHIYDIPTLTKELNTNLSDGLSPREAAVRLEKQNKRTKGKKWSLFISPSKGAFRVFFDLIANPFALTMLALSTGALLFGRTALGLTTLLVSLAAIIFSGLISYSANKTLDEMKDYASPMVRVKRGGELYHIDGRNLVCGDLIIVGKGDLVPCDARIIKCEDLEVDEFYREGLKTIRRSVRKSADESYNEDIDVKAPDAKNMLYAGSAICNGSALCLVLETGSDVFLGEFFECGAFGDKEGEPLGVKNLFFGIRGFSIVAVACLSILSLLGLVTLGRVADLFFIFTNLLSAFFFVSVNLPAFGSKEIFSSYIARAKKRKSSKKKRSDPSFVRNIKSLDTLSGITDLVLIGEAGLSLAELKACSVYVPGHGMTDFALADKLHSLLYTYVKAKREKNEVLSDKADFLTDAIRNSLNSCSFDMQGSDMTLRSLSYSYDIKNGLCFAYAETDTRFYRVGLVTDRSKLDVCEYIRVGDVLREIGCDEIAKINEAYKKFDAESLISVALISESEDKTVLEGIFSFKRSPDNEFSSVAKKLESFGVRTTLLLDGEIEKSLYLLDDKAISDYVGKDIAHSSAFRKNKLNILHGIGKYKAYVGFEREEYAALLSEMKKNGSVIAAFSVSDSHNDVMSLANLGITCDTVTYSGKKFREYVYEYLPAEGSDDCSRASQRTRLISKIIVPRANERGGGISSIFRALRLSRAAHISFAHSMLLFVLLMTPLISFTMLSPITGNILLDPLQTIALSSVIALMSFTVFSDTEPSERMLSRKRDLTIYAISLIKESMADIISLFATAALTSVAVMTLSLAGIFGEHPCFTLPIYLCMIFTLVAQVFSVRSRLVGFRDGKGRVNIKLIIYLACLVFVGAVALIPPISNELYKNGIAFYELLIFPGYILIYFLSMLIARSKRKKDPER